MTQGSLPCFRIPLSNIAGYNLAHDKIIYVWDVQKRELQSKRQLKNDKKKQLVKLEDAVLTLPSSSSLKIYLTRWLVDDLNLFVSSIIKLIGLAKVAAEGVLG